MSVRFVEHGRDRGLDPGSAGGGGGLIVPLGASRRTRLIGDTDGVTVRTAAHNLTLTELRRRRGELVIGVTAGTGPVVYQTIEAVSGTTVVATLMVYGLTWRDVPVVVCSVRDTVQASRRPLASVHRLLEGANRVLAPGACISLMHWLSADVEIEGDHRSGFASDSLHETLDPVRAGPPFAIRLFFVREIRNTREGDVEGAASQHGIVAIEDNAHHEGVELAHEIGHFLGLDHVPGRRNLMFESVPNGGRISFREAIAMNAQASRYQAPPGTSRPGVTQLDPIEL